MPAARDTDIRCLHRGCAGRYRRRDILHCVERTDEVVCIDRVPALVCVVCGDVQLEAETVRRIHTLLETHSAPDRHVPVYDFRRPVH